MLLWLVAVPMLWLTHMVCFFAHEYAHSVVAWALHAKSNPLALNYGHATVGNVLLQGDIDENVDYEPVLSTGRFVVAAVIAIAGVLIGNGMTYFAGRVMYSGAKRAGASLLMMLAFQMCLMSVGNFLSYVPLRVFTTHSDMYMAETALRVSPWVILVGLGLPFAMAMVHFYARVLPDAEHAMFPTSYASRCALVLMATFVTFEFFGRAGFSGYGAVAHWQSWVCVYVLFPVVTLLCWPRRQMLA